MNLIKQDLKLNNSDSNIGGVYMEEKIYEILVEVQKDVKDLKKGQARLEERQTNLEKMQVKLEERQINLETNQEIMKNNISKILDLIYKNQAKYKNPQ